MQSSTQGQKPFPIPTSYFSVVLGTSAMGLAWRYASNMQLAPSWIGESLLALAAVILLLLLIAFGVKIFTRKDALQTELKDLVQCCFLSLIPITGIEIGMAAIPYAKGLAEGLIWLMVIGQLAFAMYRAAGLWRGLHKMAATTPVMYLPTLAANFASAIALSELGYQDYAVLFFGAGMFSWVSLEAAVLIRLRTEPELAAPVRGIIGVQLAPAFVGGNAYLAINGGTPDMFSLILTGYGILQLLFLLRLSRWILAAGYTMSLWAFSFGLAAMTSVGFHYIASQRLVELGSAMVLIGSLLLAALWLGALGLAAKGKLFVR